MIEEIQKRPFVRPLILWITGIWLYVTFPSYLVGVLFCLFSCLALFFLWFFSKGGEDVLRYDLRWIWGVVFSILILALAILVSYRSDRIFPEEEPFFVHRMAAEAQHSLVETLDSLRLPDAEKSVLATLTLGYRQTMSQEMKRRFSVTGVSHILSVSGFHVAVICGFLSFICSAFPKRRGWSWIRYLLLITLLWLFTFITGLASSAVRAALMLSFYLTGQVLRRTGDGYNTLAAAAFCMLAYNPFYLFDIGFQLSYLAVWFILLLAPRIKGLIKVRNPLVAMPWEWIAVSVAAQMGTALLCGYYFGQFPAVFLFTNIPITLLTSILIPAAIIWLALPPWFPGFSFVQEVVEQLTHSMVSIVDVFSEVPGAALPFQIGWVEMIGGYGILALGLAYFKVRRPKVLLAALSVLLIILLNILIRRFLLLEN